MFIGIGLPIADPPGLFKWARRADAGPFRTLGLLDRLVYDNPEPLVTLAALAGATTRIRLQTEVLLGPLRETPLLAKQTATLHRMTGGRFTLGLGVGGREDDYIAAGRDVRRRGRRLDAQMIDLHRLWSGAPWSATAGPIVPVPSPSSAQYRSPDQGSSSAQGSSLVGGSALVEGSPSIMGSPSAPGSSRTPALAWAASPAPGSETAGSEPERRSDHGSKAGSEIGSKSGPGAASPAGPAEAGETDRPEVLFGGFRPAALARVARFGDGFLGAAPPAYLGRLFRSVEHSWAEAGRAGRPRLVAQGNVALGPEDLEDEARKAITAYYAPGEYAARAADGLLATPTAVRGFVRACGDLGADEVVLYCWATAPAQVDRLADAVAGLVD